MTSPGPDPPPMGHSAAYYEHRGSLLLSQRQQYHPTTSPMGQPHHPQPAHVNPSPRSPPDTHRTDPTRLQTSVSSGESGSTVGSDYKQYPSNQSYNYGSQAERGLISDYGQKPSYVGTTSADSGAYLGDPGHREMAEVNSAVFRYIQQQQIEEKEDQEPDYALWILFWMSSLDPFHCLFSALFSVFAVFLLILSLPFRLFKSGFSPSTSLIRMVGPVWRHHLKVIHAKSLTDVHTFEFSPTCLIFIQVVSPIISLGNVVAMWIVAVFWVFSIIMGNPDGTEKRDDGRAAVLMMRDWWEKCLLFAVRR